MFMLQGVNYAAGVCAYEDSENDNPWCSIAANAVTFTGAAGETNWDFCTCGKFSRTGL